MTPIERRFEMIYEIGCLACRQLERFSPCQVHHLNLDGKAGQRQLGDLFTIGLCGWHHVGLTGSWTSEQMRNLLGPSLARESKAFREKFGDDAALLRMQARLIAELQGRRAA